jgi:hypothetical protein
MDWTDLALEKNMWPPFSMDFTDLSLVKNMRRTFVKGLDWTGFGEEHVAGCCEWTCLIWLWRRLCGGLL